MVYLCRFPLQLLQISNFVLSMLRESGILIDRESRWMRTDDDARRCPRSTPDGKKVMRRWYMRTKKASKMMVRLRLAQSNGIQESVR